jgi:hypothetical protein
MSKTTNKAEVLDASNVETTETTEQPATEEVQAQTPAQDEAPQQPAEATTQFLTANSREELTAAFEALKEQNPGKTLMAGAVGQKDDGTFELKVDFVTN